MIVFRVEDENHNGPYTNRLPPCGATACNFESCPLPESDGIDNLKETDIFGFKCLDSLMSWFVNINALESNGLRVSVYEVNKRHVKHGEKQIVFDKRYACFIGVI